MKDKKVFKVPFVKSHPYQWTCPTCKMGVLELVSNSFFSKESAMSKSAHDHPNWDPEWIELVFSCFFECSNSNCKEVVACTGTGTVDWDVAVDEYGHQIQEYDEYFKPTYFQPTLHYFDIPEQTPKEVKSSILTSFSLVLANSSSASNHVRVAIELLLNNLKIKRFRTNNGKRYSINLHQRIESLPNKYAHLKELLLAIKWLGNAGSHASTPLSLDDVFDAYEILEVVLNDLYENKIELARKLAKDINKNRGPK
ncbi:DUF4145 domain-containing protein [Shewanella sp. HN-41]|uniref:DUF4145 domain-containing protein n=1 Tax=Shewanella sp. HN-41 TaxID=327275 RepID=UPI0002125E40|nr:DUF4145 domain-containing protein [Shewanella sp. HN-41]EGM67953.1 hypothetical protein SOHN41_03857 [Shewanella sp. HN-41]